MRCNLALVLCALTSPVLGSNEIFQSEGNPNTILSTATLSNYKNLFTDLTLPLDKILKERLFNYTQQLEDALQQSPFVFYSTDILINELSSLVRVIQLLNQFHPTRSVQLMVSFRYLNNSKFDWRRLGDWFYGDIPPKSMKPEELNLLKSHVYAFVLDWTSESCYNNFYHPDNIYSGSEGVLYLNTFNISFTQSMKTFVDRTFNKDESTEFVNKRVGVAYHERQIGDCRYLSKETRHADFLLVGIDFDTAKKFPLTYKDFRKYVDEVYMKNSMLEQREKVPMALYFNLAPAMHEIYDTQRVPYHYARNHRDEDYLESVKEIMYNLNETIFLKLVSFGRQWAAENQSDAVLGTYVFNATTTTQEAVSESFIPYYFRAEKWDRCLLKFLEDMMPSHTFTKFAVNEYSWKSLAGYRKKLEEKKSKDECENSLYYTNMIASKSESAQSQNSSINVLLFLSQEAATIWDYTNEYLTELVNEYKSVGILNLKTVVFNPPLENLCGLRYGDCAQKYRRIQNDTYKFAQKLLSKGVTIGCLVNRNKFLNEGSRLWSLWEGDDDIVTKSACQQFFKVAKVFIWQYTIHDMSSYGFGLNEGDYWQKKALMRILIGRQMFMKQYRGKEVILQFVESGNYYCPLSKTNGFFDTLSSWPEVQGVPVILQPAFDVKSCWWDLYEWKRQNIT